MLTIKGFKKEAFCTAALFNDNMACSIFKQKKYEIKGEKKEKNKKKSKSKNYVKEPGKRGKV